MSLTVVVIDRSPPVRHTQGNELIARHLFARLRRDHRIVLVAPVVGPIEFARDAVADLFDDVHLVPRAARVAALAGFVESHLAALPVGLPGPLDPGAARRLETVVTRVVAAEDPDVLHVRQLPMAKYGALGGSRPRLLELIDSEALASARDPDRSVRSGLRRRIAPALERRAIRGYDAVTTVAEPDAAAVRALL